VNTPWPALPLGNHLGTHRVDGWVSPRGGLDVSERGERCPAPAGNPVTIPRTYTSQNRDFMVPRLLKEDTGPEYRYIDSRCCSAVTHSSEVSCPLLFVHISHSSTGCYRSAAQHQVFVSF